MFGAIAVAREYGHHTVVPTFLASPRRHRAVLAQLAAVAGVGAVLSVVGAERTVTAVAIAVRTTDFGFLVSASDVARVIAASGFAGAAGAVLGAGIAAVVRNVGGAVTSAVLVDYRSTTRRTARKRLRPVDARHPRQRRVRTATDVAAPAALAAWAIMPAMIGLIAVQRRDVV